MDSLESVPIVAPATGQPRIPIQYDAIARFCRCWHLTEFSLFGSVLRDDFNPASDVDVLIEFEPGSTAGLFEWARMRGELRTIFGREVDLVEKAGLRNPHRLRSILGSRAVIYATR